MELSHYEEITESKPVCVESCSFLQLKLEFCAVNVYDSPFLLLGYSKILWGYTKWKESCKWNSKEEWENEVCWRNQKSEERNKGNQGQFSRYNIELYKINSVLRFDIFGASSKYRFQLSRGRRKVIRYYLFLVNISYCIHSLVFSFTRHGTLFSC